MRKEHLSSSSAGLTAIGEARSERHYVSPTTLNNLFTQLSVAFAMIGMTVDYFFRDLIGALWPIKVYWPPASLTMGL